MIKRIIFLMETQFNLRDYNRLGIEFLKSEGFDVVVWDLSLILHPTLAEKYAPADTCHFDGLSAFKNKKDYIAECRKLSETDFVISWMSYYFASYEAFWFLSRSPVKYAVCCANTVPVMSIKQRHWIQKLQRWANFGAFGIIKILCLKLPFKWLGIKPANMILIGGKKSTTRWYPIDQSTEIVKIHSLDYDLYSNERKTDCTQKQTAVFIDEFLPFHPEYEMTGERVPIAADRYFKMINDFFDVLERKTGLEVVIAAHPRSNYETHLTYYKDRKCVRGETIRLIRESQLVLSHCSTAVNFANLFYKPLMFITCADFHGTSEGNQVETMAQAFAKVPLYIDKKIPEDFEFDLTVDKKAYDHYRHEYIKSPDSEDAYSWEIVASRLKKDSSRQVTSPSYYVKV